MFRIPDGKENDFYLKKEGPAKGILALTKDPGSVCPDCQYNDPIEGNDSENEN